MQRSTFLATGAAFMTVPFSGSAAVAAGGDAYDLATPTGTIYGTLSLPPKVAKPPVALIIAGSGPVDRDGNSLPALNTNVYLLLAQALAKQGVASVRYDKRGIAASFAAASDESKLRFEDYIADAAAWVAKIRADDRFGKIAIAGHSEGSLIGMVAAERAPVDAFVSLDGAGYPAADALRTQLGPKLAATPDLAAANTRILDALVAGHTVGDVPAPLLALYRPSVQPYLISWFRYDPRVEIAKLRGPVTIVQGAADIQVPVADAKALEAARPASKLVLVAGMSHVLKEADHMPAERQAQTVYADPSLPIDPAVPDAIVAAFAAAPAS